VSAKVDADEQVLVDGRYLSAVLPTAPDDRHEVFLLLAEGLPNGVDNDGWWLPTDPSMLRGIARDLLTAADQLDGGK